MKTQDLFRASDDERDQRSATCHSTFPGLCSGPGYVLHPLTADWYVQVQVLRWRPPAGPVNSEAPIVSGLPKSQQELSSLGFGSFEPLPGLIMETTRAD